MASWRAKARAEARRAYMESRESLAEIAARLGFSESTILRWAREEGWARRGQGRPRPPSALDPSEERIGLANRLYAAIERMLARLEGALDHDNTETAADRERTTRMIGTLVRSMEKVKELGTEHSGSIDPNSGSGGSYTAAEADRIRNELADRITRLTEEYYAQGLRPGASDAGAGGLDRA
jgi:transposase-like protein